MKDQEIARYLRLAIPDTYLTVIPDTLSSKALMKYMSSKKTRRIFKVKVEAVKLMKWRKRWKAKNLNLFIFFKVWWKNYSNNHLYSFLLKNVLIDTKRVIKYDQK